MPTVLIVDDPATPLFGNGKVPPSMVPVGVVLTDPAQVPRHLEGQPFDAVVVAVPGRNTPGVAQLEQVAALHPDLLRVVVVQDGGNAPAEIVRLAHRMFDAADAWLAVGDTVEQVGRLQPLLTDPQLARLVGRLTMIPTAPVLYQRLLRECRSANPSLRTVGALVADDPGLAAKLLQLANSALYARGSHVVDPTVAVQRVGLDAVKSLALTAHVFGHFEERLRHRFDVDGLWRHGLVVNSFAAIVSRTEHASLDLVDVAATGGLLHDLGRMILAANLPDEYEAVFKLTAGETSVVGAEIKVFGVSHAAVGAYLLALWGLPVDVVDAVARSHEPAVVLENRFEAVTAVRAADMLAAEALGKDAEDDEGAPTFADGPHVVRWRAWREACLRWAGRTPAAP